jgi:hypothetical protein
MKRAVSLSFGRVATNAKIALVIAIVSIWGSLTSAANQSTNQTTQPAVAQAPVSRQPFSAHVQAAAKQAKSFEDFVSAIHHVETTGRVGVIYGDGRRSLGPLQISQAAWRDATRFDPSIGGKYSDCKNLEYSTRIMRAYLQAHDPIAFRNGDWQTCARLWNSGPTWYKKTHLTNKYWAAVRTTLQRQAS